MSEGGRSYLLNAEDNALAADVATPDGTITVVSSVNLPTVPFYLVIDPFEFENREYLYCTNVAGTVLTVTRNLEGSTGTVHTVASPGNLVRFAYDKQHLDDIWDAIEGVAEHLVAYPYQFDIATDGLPAAGFWQRDNVSAASATVLYLNELDELGNDQAQTAAEIRVNDVMTANSRTGDGYERYRVTGLPVLTLDVYAVPVEYITNTGTPFIDNEKTAGNLLLGRDIELGDLRDVDVVGVSDLQILGYSAGSDTWGAVENRGNKGIITLEYLYDANQTASPAAGDVAPNNATPSLTTVVRASTTDSNGDSVDFILGNVSEGDLIVLAQRADDTNREDYTVVSSVDMGTYYDITVTFDAATGTINDNDPIFFYLFQNLPDLDLTYLRLDAVNDPMQSDLSLGSNKLALVGDGTLDTDGINKLQMETYADAEAIEQAILRMRWTDLWAPGTYQLEDVSRDGEWTMVANKVTTDRPAPQPVGSPLYLYNGVGGTTSQIATDITFGSRYTVGTLIQITGYRVYTVTGNEYSIYTVTDPLGTPIVKPLIEFVADTTGWRDINISGQLINVGAVFDLLVIVHEPDPTPTVFSGFWDYDTPQNIGTPAAGEITHSNNQPQTMQVSKTDDDAVDRSADLATLNTGDIIQFAADTRWSITQISDQGTFINFTVAPAVQEAPDGRTEFFFETVTATPVTYFQDAGYWATAPYPVQGILQIEDGAVNVSDTAYGADILVQEFDASADWDILALSGGGASGGESGGNAPNGLPVGGTAGQYLEKIDGDDFNSGWFDHKTVVDAHHTRYTDAEAIAAGSGLYLPLAGGTMTGNIEMGTQRINGVSIITGQVGGSLVVRAGTGQILNLNRDDDVQALQFHTNGNIVFFNDVGGEVAKWRQVGNHWQHLTELDMSSNKITSVADPTLAQDAATKQYVDDTAGLYLPLAGGNMTGAINMDGNNISNVTTLLGAVSISIIPGTGGNLDLHDGTALRVRIIDGTDGFLYSGDGTTPLVQWGFGRLLLNLGASLEGSKLTSVADPTSAQDAATKQYVDDRDALYLPLTGGTVTGAITVRGTLLVENLTHPSTFQINASQAQPTYFARFTTTFADQAFTLNVGGNKILATTGFNTPDKTFLYSDDVKTLGLESGIITAYSALDMQSLHKVINLVDGVNPQDAATKAQLDAATGGFDGSHNSLTDITADNHHTRYDDSEAVAANTGIWLSLGGGTMNGAIAMGGNDISGVVAIKDTGGVSRFTAAQPGNTNILDSGGASRLYADTFGVIVTGRLGGVTDPTSGTQVGDRDYNDLRYVPIANDPTGVYLPLAGGTMTGAIAMGGNDLQLGGGNVTGWTNLIGNTGVPATIRPSSGQRVIFRDDSGTRFILEPRANGDIDWYDTSTQKLAGWDNSNTQWYHESRLSMQGHTIVEVDSIHGLSSHIMEINAGPAGQVWIGVSAIQGILGVSSTHVTISSADLDLTGNDITNASQVQVPATTGVFVAGTLTMSDVSGSGRFVYGGTEIINIAASHFRVGVGATDVRFQGIGGFATTGSAANMWCDPSNGLWRVSTSARRHKTDILAGDSLADLVLEPVTFHHTGDDKDHLGFVADDIPDERAIIRNEDGEVINYDVQAILAILAAKVNRLENA